MNAQLLQLNHQTSQKDFPMRSKEESLFSVKKPHRLKENCRKLKWNLEEKKGGVRERVIGASMERL